MKNSLCISFPCDVAHKSSNARIAQEAWRQQNVTPTFAQLFKRPSRASDCFATETYPYAVKGQTRKFMRTGPHLIVEPGRTNDHSSFGFPHWELEVFCPLEHPDPKAVPHFYIRSCTGYSMNMNALSELALDACSECLRCDRHPLGSTHSQY